VTNAEYAADDPLPAPDRPCPGAALYLADCRDALPLLPSGSFDLVFTDPPYPEISRPYGRWTEAEWWDLMRAVVPECMRVLKPTGSAVFVLQPNSERVGRMRTWLWDFMSWVGKEWGVVQDAYWWNRSALPVGGACNAGLMRPSVRHFVWVGPPDCYRDQGAVLLQESDKARTDRLARRFDRPHAGSRRRSGTEGARDCGERMAGRAVERGGVTPFNLIPLGNDARWSGGTDGHSASTPRRLCDFWVRYLCPPGGAALDPFSGTATTGLAALKHGCDYTGIEAVPEYHATACRRLAEAAGPLFAGPAAVDGPPPAVG
jgi:hypothetical protein